MNKQVKKLIIALGKEFHAEKVKVTPSRGRAILKLDPENIPAKLAQAKRGVLRAIRKAGFRSQGTSVFPYLARREPTTFYVQRKVGKGDYEEAAIALLGTPEKPELLIQWI